MRIAISGKAGSGKDTVGAKLARAFEIPITHLADALKVEYFNNEIMCDKAITKEQELYLLNLTDEEKIVNTNKQKHLPYVRQGLIQWGQMKRKADPDYWIKKLDLEASQVLPDLRFTNELMAFHKAGFILIRVETSEDKIVERGGPAYIDDISETALDDNILEWDFIIDNNKSIGALRRRLREVIKRIKEIEHDRTSE